MDIETFKLEEWLKKRENKTRFNLAENCVYAVTLDDFFHIARIDKKSFLNDFCSIKMNYGNIDGGTPELKSAIAEQYKNVKPEDILAVHGATFANTHLVWSLVKHYGNIDGGTPELKSAIAEQYKNVKPEDILAVHGATFANTHLVWSLVKPDDNIVAIYPDYQQFISLPKSFGAEVRMLHRSPEDGYAIHKDELDRICDENTRLITLSNPNNPTGALLSMDELNELISIARKYNAYIICDEVYNHILQDDQVCPSIADLYEKGISVGSLSKTCSMAGLRLGWIATRDKDAMQIFKQHSAYNMSSVGGLKEYIAISALKHQKALIDRNMSLLRVNLITLDGWLRQNKKHLSYVYPKAGSTVLVFYHQKNVSSIKFCNYLFETTGTLITPGDVFSVPNSFRISYACDHRQLVAGLMCLSEACKKLNENPHFLDDESDEV